MMLNGSNELETLVKKVPFDGKQDSWRQWRNRALTFAGSKGFRGALVRDLSPFITEEQYELGDEAEATVAAAVAAATTPVGDDMPSIPAVATALQRKHYKMNIDAFNFLLLSCEGSAFGFVEKSISKEFPEGNAHNAWLALLGRYESSNIGNDYVDINKGFAECKLDGLVGDPDKWFQDLEYWNHRLAQIDDGRY